MRQIKKKRQIKEGWWRSCSLRKKHLELTDCKTQELIVDVVLRSLFRNLFLIPLPSTPFHLSDWGTNLMTQQSTGLKTLWSTGHILWDTRIVCPSVSNIGLMVQVKAPATNQMQDKWWIFGTKCFQDHALWFFQDLQHYPAFLNKHLQSFSSGSIYSLLNFE